MKTRSALPTLALAALLTGLVPAPQARAEPEKSVAGDAAAPADAESPSDPEVDAVAEQLMADARRESEEKLATLRAQITEKARALGPEHADMLAARRALADELSRQGVQAVGDPKLREELEERSAVLALVRRVHGEDDPATYDDWEKLIRVSGRLKRRGEVVKESRGLIAAMEKRLGPDDKQTLGRRKNLASCLLIYGQYAEAEREYRTLIAIRGRNQVAPEVHLLVNRIQLAHVLDKSGKHAEAEVMHRLLLAEVENKEGAEGRGAMEGRKRLARCLLAQGKADEAIRELEIIQALGKEVPQKYPDFLYSVGDLLAEAREALAAAADETPAPAPAKGEAGEGKGESDGRE